MGLSNIFDPGLRGCSNASPRHLSELESDIQGTRNRRKRFGQRSVSVRSALGQRKIQSGISRPFQLQIERFLMHLKGVGKHEGPTVSLHHLLDILCWNKLPPFD